MPRFQQLARVDTADHPGPEHKNPHQRTSLPATAAYVASQPHPGPEAPSHKPDLSRIHHRDAVEGCKEARQANRRWVLTLSAVDVSSRRLRCPWHTTAARRRARPPVPGPVVWRLPKPATVSGFACARW